MTSNQIALAKLHEERRHNYATEDLTRDSNEIAGLRAGIEWKNADTNLLNAEANRMNAQTNAQNAAIRGQELYETVRHNYALEAESMRHNQAQEGVSLLQAQEQQRANQASEDLRYQQNTESQRHNEAAEQLTGAGQRASILGGLINTVGNLVGKFIR